MLVNVLILIVASLSCVLPFVHLFAISLSDSAAITAGKVVFWPVEFTTAAYEYAFKGGVFLRAAFNSVVLVIVGTSVNLVMMVLTAYPLSKEKTELLGRNVYMGFFVLTMLIGGGLIPTYLVITRLHLKNTLWALVLPGALPVYNMVILMNFMRGLPRELIEAGRIDGASEIKIIYKILLPLLKPALATVGLFCIVSHWNNWFAPVIYMNDQSKLPLAAHLRRLLVDFSSMIVEAGADVDLLLLQMNAQTGRAAQLFLASIPVLVAYPFLQKYFTSGLTIGSVKG